MPGTTSRARALASPAVAMTGRARRALGPFEAYRTALVNRLWARVRRWGAFDWRHRLADRFGAMGEGSWVAFPPGDCYNLHTVVIGRDCFLNSGVTLAIGMPTETYAPDHPPVVEIGDRTTVGKDCWFVARQSIVLEDDVTIAPNVYFTDHNHTYADRWLPVGQQVLQVEPVRVGAGTWIGTGVVVLPGTTIGRNCAVAAGAVVRGEIPDHSVVAGVPGRVVRRWVDGEGWVPPMAREVVVIEGWPVGVPPEGEQ